jgi:hypothetical protein
MTEIMLDQTNDINGGVVPLFVAIAVYGELAVFAAAFSGAAMYNTLK